MPVRRDIAIPLFLIMLVVFYVSAAGSNLANYLPIGGDEVLIMSASHKLATTGVLGSDLASGLPGAEFRFFLNLPVQNLLQAAVFVVAGADIWQARLPSLVAGALLVALTAAFAWRSFGWSVALLTAAMLVLWRSNLLDTDPRPPLLAVAQSGRYDLVVVALFWATMLLLQACVVRPRRSTAIFVGISAGLATLTQFYGIAAIVVTAAAFFIQWRGAAWRETGPRWAAVGCASVLIPYALFVLSNVDAFAAQAAVQGSRVEFFDPRFWLTNVARESSRYASLTEPSSATHSTLLIGPWLVLAGALPGVVPLVAFSRGSPAERALPFFSLAVPFAVLAFAEQTKAVLYAFFIVPSLCLSLASGLDWVIRRASGHDRVRFVSRVMQLGGIVVIVALGVEGVRGYRLSLRESERVTPYHHVGRQIAALMPEPQPVLGAWRWWWALRDRPYFAVTAFWTQSRLAAPHARPRPSLREEVDAKRASYLLVDRDFRADLDRTVDAYRIDAARFIEQCTSAVGAIDDGTYGRIEVRRISCATSADVAK